MIKFGKKSLSMGIAVLAISAMALMGVITTNVQASNVVDSKLGEGIVHEVSSNKIEDGINDPLPDVLLDDSEHPDAIKTKDGLFVKSDESEDNFDSDEVVYDVLKTLVIIILRKKRASKQKF
ncbi:hypothetical protein [Paenibacillus sp.]|jgi:hypothetical protein|uniref:hypothetical protein n=1 Tax=Paenibacillus sp. TaxID=58172 RepID=UPI0028249E5A|nr:hypothetical protein [Paenibacillus sp.]MDR0270761.1 hypothetical protein [Paenibacillus sp.]